MLEKMSTHYDGHSADSIAQHLLLRLHFVIDIEIKLFFILHYEIIYFP